MPFGLSRAASFSGGGTISGSLTINGDLTVNGDGSGNYDEIVNGNMTISSTNKLVLGGDGSDTYLQESGADVLDIYVGGANMIKLTESTTDTVLITGDLTVGVDDTGNDVRIYSATASEGIFYDASEDELGLLLTTKLKFHDIGGGEEIFASANGHLEINAGTTLDITAPTVDLNSATEFNIDTAAYDLNASGAVEVDGAGVSIDGTDDSNLTVTGSNKDLAVSVAGGSTQTLTISSAGTGTNAIDINATAGGVDIDANGAISLDSAAGSIDMNVVDGQTVAIGLNGAVETLWKPHGTAGSELWSTINTAGTTDGSDAAGSILLSAVAGGIGLAWADGKDLWAEGGRAVITANEDAADAIKLHADTGTSQTITIVNDAGTGAAAIGLTASAGGVTVGLGGGAGDDFIVDTTTLVVESDNNRVGIGTASPSDIIDIQKNQNATTNFYLRNTDTTDSTSRAYLNIISGNKTFQLGAIHGDNAYINAPSGASLYFQDGGANNMVIDADGKVGIGETSPDAALEIAGAHISAKGLLHIDSTDHAYMALDAHSASHDSGIYFSENGTQQWLMGYDGSDDRFVQKDASNNVIFVLDVNSRISLSNNDSNTGNTVFGYTAFNTSSDNASDNNTVVGHLAMGTGSVAGATYNTAVGYRAGDDITSGDKSTYIGAWAGDASADVDEAVAIGYAAMGAGTTTDAANGSVAIGSDALNALTSGVANTALGYRTLKTNQAGDYNVAVGHQALETFNSADIGRNTAVGINSLNALDSGVENTVIGSFAGDAMAVGESYNTVVGADAMGNVDEGTAGGDVDYNVAIGANALVGGDFAGNDRQLQGNIAIGAFALDGTGANAQTGTIAIGHQSLSALTTGVGNTAIGYQAGDALTSQGGNTLVGYTAGGALTTGDGENTFIGNDSGNALTIGQRNVAIGFESFTAGAAEANDNVAIGMRALDATGTAAVGACIGIGSSALGGINNTGAVGSIGIGHYALSALTSGAGNIGIGYQALSTHVDGNRNIAIGYQAMSDTDISGSNADASSENIFMGYQAGAGTWANAESNHNTAIGNYTMGGALNAALRNVAIGHQSGGALTTGVDNVMIGYQAGNQGVAVNTGTQNIIIGSATDASAVGGTNQVVIGYDATGVANNSVTLGNASVTAVYMSQDSGATVHAGGIDIDSAATSGQLLDLDADSLTSGRIADFYSNSSDTTARQLVKITNDHASATGAQCLFIDQDANASSVKIDSEGTTTPIFMIEADALTTGSAGYIYSNSANASARSLLNVSNDHASADSTVGVYIHQDGAGPHIEFAGAGNGGIKFGKDCEASDVNTLDDYEEGTWTILLKDTSANVLTHDNDTCTYIKIGSLVHVSGYTNISSLGSASGAVVLHGLPFAVGSGTQFYSTVDISTIANWALPSAGDVPVGYVVQNSATAYFNIFTATNTNIDATAAHITANGSFVFSATYHVA